MSTVQNTKIVTDGLVLCLDAANTKSYVSGSTTWNDISRSGFSGTLINGPTFNGNNGGSIVFDLQFIIQVKGLFKTKLLDKAP